MKYNRDLVVTNNERLNESCFLLQLGCDIALEDIGILPGQFVNILVDGIPQRILRRPISIHDIDTHNNEIHTVVQCVGPSTNKLATVKKGEKLSVMFPLGNHFPLEETKPLLIGGGVGTAPLYYLAKVYNEKGIRVSVLIGARTERQLFLIDKYKTVADVYIATEDASKGEKGLVTNHSIMQQEFSSFITCGPEPMMKAVSKMAKDKSIKCYASLENRMACGIGACLCCVTQTKVSGNQCVCTSGPIFDTNELNWQ